MGFYYGTELSLNAIIDQYPDLSRRAMQAKLDFEIAHKKAEEQIEDELSEQVKVDMAEMKKQIIHQARNQYNLENVSKTESEQFLSTFDNDRIKGNHELYSEYVSIFLRHNPYYSKHPIKEFTDGYRELFESDGHSKSLGLNFSIEYPKSWENQKGKHPHILTLLQSGDNACSITIAVKNLLEDLGIDEKDLTQEEFEVFKSEEFANLVNDEVFSPEYGRSMIKGMGLENMNDFNFSKSRLDRQPAMVVKVSGDLIRSLINVKTYNIFYLVIYENKLITLSAMMIESPDASLDEVREKYEYLSEMTINSLIIKDRW